MMVRRLPRALLLLLPLFSARLAGAGGEPSLTEYVRLSQDLERQEQAAEREVLANRVTRTREALLREAARSSRVAATAERRPDYDSPGERHVVRLAARDGHVTVEALSGIRIEAPDWERAEEIPMQAYLGLMRRLLESPVVLADMPAQRFDPSAPGPCRAVVVQLIIGDEEWRLQALHGAPYERLKEVAAWVLEFARSVPAVP